MNQALAQKASEPAEATKLAVRTHQLLTDFYHRKPGIFTAILHPDVLWIGGADSQYLKGYQEVYQYLEEQTSKLPPKDLNACHYDTIFSSETMCIITGCFRGQTESCRLTFVWKLYKGDFKLFHLHLSHPLESQDTSVPLSHNSKRDTCQYSKTLLEEQRAYTTAIPIQERGGQTVHIPAGDIQYIEASNINCRIYISGNSDPSVIRYPISKLLAALPSNFVQIHRSYIVNRNWVASVCRYYVRLHTGKALPIPEKRYREVFMELSTD